MESLSSENKALALDILYDIQSAIERIQERTKNIHSADDFLSSPENIGSTENGTVHKTEKL